MTYRAGKDKVVADVLSRKAEDLKTLKDKKQDQHTLHLLKQYDGYFVFAGDKPDETDLALLDDGEALPPLSELKLLDELLTANREDESLSVYQSKATTEPDSRFELNQRLLTYQGQLVVPETGNLRTSVRCEAYSRLATAHPGRNKTCGVLQGKYWWPGMMADIDRYVNNCWTCRSFKVPRDKTPGKLHPIPLAKDCRAWQSICVDFKSMPLDKLGFNNVLVMVDRFSKMVWTCPCKDTTTARDMAFLYYQGPFRVFGPPKEVISDNGPQFISDFIQELSSIWGTE